MMTNKVLKEKIKSHNVGGMVSGGFKTTNLSKRTEVNE